MGLSNSKYDLIMKQYNDRQLANRHRLEERRQEIYHLIPSFHEIDDTIADFSVEQAKKLIQGDNQALPVLRAKIDALSEQKASLLKEYEFPENYLAMTYECPDCKDTGYIDGKKCHCLKQTLIEQLYDQSNIKSVLLKENFDFFTYEYYNEAEKERIEKVVKEAKLFIKNFDTEYRNMLFFGDVGCGKTFLSNCIARELLNKGCSVIYFTAFQLFDLLARKTFHNDNEDADLQAVYDDIFHCDLLVLDDLGTETANTFTVSQLFLILNERHQREKSTIISTNMSIQKLKDTYSERSISRILGNYELYLFKGEDIRPKKQMLEHRK